VGAGPGHPELLTLKAADLLKNCDVVVYDRLIQEEVLALAKPSAERIYMGKPLGKHDSRQDEAHEVLARKALEGKMVVRLKGGDPFVFGRGGEEADFLSDNGIPFEVIPGITSAFAAPLSAGIAVTHRGAASSVAVVTGHEATKDHGRVNWKALTGIDTLVFLMGVSNAGTISQSLIEEGMSPETPAALIQMAFWHDEQTVTGTLATIAKEAERAGIRPPATLVIGEVVRMREKIAKARRDLRRRADGSSRFEPAPAPDELLRLASAGLGSQVLGFALEIKLFDCMEETASGASLAKEFGLDAGALGEMLESLVALGVTEKHGGGYRNLELASRYLRAASPESLRPALLHQARISVQWDSLASYAREGCRDSIPDALEEEHEESCEALAKFAAPSVAEGVDLGETERVLLIGYGGESYREAIAKRWPELEFRSVNPFPGNRGPMPLRPDVLPDGGPRGAVILSGLLASANPGEVQKILEAAASGLSGGGLLALHDSFLPGGALPPPEVVLGSLGRRIRRGGCRTWTLERLGAALRELGFERIESAPLQAGTALVTARKRG